MNLITHGDFSRRVDAFKGTLRTFDPILDRITLLALISIVVAGVLTKRLTVKSAMYWPLAAVAAAALVMPAEMATANFVGIRLPTALILLAIASSNIAFRGKLWTILVAGTLTVIFLSESATSHSNGN